MSEETKKAIEEFKPGVYKHFKGKLDIALFLANDCEDPEKKFVVYASMYENDGKQLWIREVTDFMGYKTLEDGTKVKRFEFQKSI